MSSRCVAYLLFASEPNTCAVPACVFLSSEGGYVCGSVGPTWVVSGSLASAPQPSTDLAGPRRAKHTQLEVFLPPGRWLKAPR